jgi:hypothetical protein
MSPPGECCRRVGTVSDFLTVGFSVGAVPIINCRDNNCVRGGFLKATGRGGNLPACPPFIAYATQTESSF